MTPPPPNHQTTNRKANQQLDGHHVLYQKLPAVNKQERKPLYNELKQQWKDFNALGKVPAALTKLLVDATASDLP